LREDADRAHRLDHRDYLAGDRIALHVAGREDVVAAVFGEEFPRGAQVQEVDSVQHQPLRGGILAKLGLGRLEGDQQRGLSGGDPGDQEVQAEGRLPGSGLSPNQVGAFRDQTSVQDFVQPRQPGGLSLDAAHVDRGVAGKSVRRQTDPPLCNPATTAAERRGR
jgi:hypothetical protein